MRSRSETPLTPALEVAMPDSLFSNRPYASSDGDCKIGMRRSAPIGQVWEWIANPESAAKIAREEVILCTLVWNGEDEVEGGIRYVSTVTSATPSAGRGVL